MDNTISTSYRLELSEPGEPLAARAADLIASTIDLSLAERDRCCIALAGGSSPAGCYSLLGRQHLPWKRVDVVLGDERWVPADDPASNALMVRKTLLAEGPGASACLHEVPTSLASPDQGAEAYSETIRLLCPGDPPVLDFVLLGLGDDGHTASLFPGTEAASENNRIATVGLGKGLPRITLTAPVLSSARQVVFLVSGESKAEALRRLLDPQESSERTPARRVQPGSTITVLADNAAASLLTI